MRFVRVSAYVGTPFRRDVGACFGLMPAPVSDPCRRSFRSMSAFLS
jgi:hypothetical protein